MSKTKVVHLVEALNVGGLERNLALLVTGLDRARYDQEVWCMVSGGPMAELLETKGFGVRVLRLWAYYLPHHLVGLVTRLRAVAPHIVHTHGEFAGIFGRVAAILARVPVVLNHAQNRPPQDQRFRHVWQNKTLTALSHGIIACSEDTMRYYLDEERIPSEKLVVIHNCVDETVFRPAPKDRALMAELGLTDDEWIIGTVARMTDVKGHRFLIEAAPTILKQEPRTRFLMVGDGPERPVLESLAKQLSVDRQFVFTGIRRDVPDLLALLDVFVLPTAVREGLPLSIAEAMACRKPVVATDVGGVREVVKHAVTGLVVPPKDSNALAAAILDLLSHPSKRDAFATAGLSYCLAEYSASLSVKRLDALYTNLLSGRGLALTPMG
ncbi:MAG: glycosyltransferase [Planctomycetes bacterium]|nr:glycosyltransferase [Planctomycetota bacterium]MBM4083336.1 glycosyltransferase [Planctomycetota bacterium]